MTRAEIMQEIINLKSELNSMESSIGDWKITKIYEARLMGLEDPYNAEELIALRQKHRDKINELQKQLERMDEENA